MFSCNIAMRKYFHFQYAQATIVNHEIIDHVDLDKTSIDVISKWRDWFYWSRQKNNESEMYDKIISFYGPPGLKNCLLHVQFTLHCGHLMFCWARTELTKAKRTKKI